MLKGRCHRVFLWCFKVFITYFLLKMLHSRVLVHVSWSPPPSSLPGKFSMDEKRPFFNSKSMYMGMVSNRSNKTTGSSLIRAKFNIKI